MRMFLLCTVMFGLACGSAVLPGDTGNTESDQQNPEDFQPTPPQEPNLEGPDVETDDHCLRTTTDFPGDAYMYYLYPEAYEYRNGRRHARVSAAFVVACADLVILAPQVTFIQEGEANDRVQNTDDPTGIILDEGGTTAFASTVLTMGDDARTVMKSQEFAMDAALFAEFALSEPVFLRKGESTVLVFDTDIAPNPGLKNVTQDFSVIPNVRYRSLSGVCATDQGCVPNVEPVGPSQFVRITY